MALDLEDGGSSLASELTDGQAGHRAEDPYHFFPPERDIDEGAGGLLPCTYHESPTGLSYGLGSRLLALLRSMYHAILDGCLFVVVICMGCLLYDVEVTIRDNHSAAGDPPDGRAFGRVVIRDETSLGTTCTHYSQVRVSAAALHRAHSMASRRRENVTSNPRPPQDAPHHHAPIHSSYRTQDGIV